MKSAGERGPGTGSTIRRSQEYVRISAGSPSPVEVSTSWFPAELGRRAPKLVEPERMREGTVMYVEEATGRRGSYGEDRVCARLATEEEGDELGLELPAAVLVVHHVVYDLQDRPLRCGRLGRGRRR
nr:UTRA domain-containing protein [Streptomyces sp. MZ04]